MFPSKFLFYKNPRTIFKNYFLKLFSKTIIKLTQLFFAKKKKNRPIDIQEIKNPIRVHFGICLGDFLKRCYDLKRIYHEGQENVNAHKS